MRISAQFRVVLFCAVAVLAAHAARAQITAAGLTVIQSPPGVYYVVYADSTRTGRAQFFYLNYNTQEYDKIVPAVDVAGTFSGTSLSTGRSVSGQIQSESISVTYDGVSETGQKESIYGPTSQYAGQWLGYVSDPSIGFGFGELFISSQGECFVYYLQDFEFDVGIGTIDAQGNAAVPLLGGGSIFATFSPDNGQASGVFSYSFGGTNEYFLSKAVAPRLANISTRGFVGSGDQVLIAGFIVRDGGKTVAIIAKGPSLTQSGVNGVLTNPRVDLYLGSQRIASNSNWRTDASASEIAASGVGPADDREAALQVDLEPGAYTAIVSSEDQSTGIGLVEVYGVGGPVGN